MEENTNKQVQSKITSDTEYGGTLHKYSRCTSHALVFGLLCWQRNSLFLPRDASPKRNLLAHLPSPAYFQLPVQFISSNSRQNNFLWLLNILIPSQEMILYAMTEITLYHLRESLLTCACSLDLERENLVWHHIFQAAPQFDAKEVFIPNLKAPGFFIYGVVTGRSSTVQVTLRCI